MCCRCFHLWDDVFPPPLLVCRFSLAHCDDRSMLEVNDGFGFFVCFSFEFFSFSSIPFQFIFVHFFSICLKNSFSFSFGINLPSTVTYLNLTNWTFEAVMLWQKPSYSTAVAAVLNSAAVIKKILCHLCTRWRAASLVDYSEFLCNSVFCRTLVLFLVPLQWIQGALGD